MATTKTDIAHLEHHEVIFAPTRTGMGVGPVLPDLLDSGMVKHQVMIAKSRDGMSAFAGMPVDRDRQSKRPMSGLLGSIIQRI